MLISQRNQGKELEAVFAYSQSLFVYFFLYLSGKQVTIWETLDPFLANFEDLTAGRSTDMQSEDILKII